MKQTFVTVIVVAQDSEGKILLLQRSSTRHNHPNIWNVVTGFIQERESVENAALRELKEETNLEGSIIKVSEPTTYPEAETNWVGFVTLVQIDNKVAFKMDESESQAFEWLSLQEAALKSEWVLEHLKALNLI